MQQESQLYILILLANGHLLNCASLCEKYQPKSDYNDIFKICTKKCKIKKIINTKKKHTSTQFKHPYFLHAINTQTQIVQLIVIDTCMYGQRYTKEYKIFLQILYSVTYYVLISRNKIFLILNIIDQFTLYKSYVPWLSSLRKKP